MRASTDMADKKKSSDERDVFEKALDGYESLPESGSGMTKEKLRATAGLIAGGVAGRFLRRKINPKSDGVLATTVGGIAGGIAAQQAGAPKKRRK